MSCCSTIKAFLSGVLALLLSLHYALLSAEVIDRVVAYVDDTPVTLYELENFYKTLRTLDSNLKPLDAINTLINRKLLLKEATRLNIKGDTEDEIINRYIHLKIRLYVRVSDREVIQYFKKHKKQLAQATLESVKDKIRKLLIEQKVNEQLKAHLQELRKKALIKINYVPEKL